MIDSGNIPGAGRLPCEAKWMPIWLFAAILSLVTPVAMPMESTAQPPRLVIIGASYAGEWGRPPFAGYTVINKGVGGEDSSQVLQRFDRDVIAEAPAATLIWGHINDFHRAPGGDMQAAAQKVRQNLSEMTTRASRAGIRVIIATEVTLSRPQGVVAGLRGFVGKLLGKQDYRQRISDHVIEVNEFIRGLASANGYVLLDVESALKGSDGYRNPDFDAEDASHIGPTGYATLTRHALATVPRP